MTANYKDLKNFCSVNLKKYNFDLVDNADKKDAEEIIKEYSSRICEPSIDEAEVLLEQYNVLKARKLPAKDWITRTISELSKKDYSKQSVQYLIGIIRNRMNYGWGTLKSAEEQLIIQKLESMLGQQNAMDLSEKIYELMGSYGSTRIAFAIHKINVGEVITKALKEELVKQFPQKTE